MVRGIACSTFVVCACVWLTACATDQGADPVGWRIDTDHPPGVIEVNFQSAGKRLNGLIYTANGPGPHPTVVLLHGFPGNEKNLDLAQVLRRDGFNVLFFHYRGSWGSEGVYSFSNIIEDVAAATRMLRARATDYRVDPERLVPLGHSMGGFAALQGAARDASIRCVGAMASADLGARARDLVTDPERAKGFGAYADSLQMLNGLTGARALQEISNNRERFDMRALAPSLRGKSVLLVAAAQDRVLPVADVHEPMAAAYAAQPQLQLTARVLDGDHSFSWTRDELAATVLNWIQGCR